MDTIKPDSHSAIIEAGFLVFADNPGASLADVAAKAGVGRATLHRHFPARHDLVVALAKAARDELNAAVDAAVGPATSVGEGLKLALAAMIPLAGRHMFLASEPVETDPDLRAAYAADQQELIQEIELAKAEGVFASDIPSRWIAESYEAVLYAGWAMVRDEEATPKQAADLAWTTLTRGLGA